MKKNCFVRLSRTEFHSFYGVMLLCCAIAFAGCSGKSVNGNSQRGDDVSCLCPPTVYLQPYGNFTKNEASRLGKELEKHLFDMFSVDLDCEILPPLPLSDSLMNKAKSRYRADKIIRSLSAKADDHNIYIGLTHKDISCSIRGKADWGVQGLSLIPGKACVVSTFRVKNRHDFWKVTCHEFIHTYFNYHHCPKNDPSCLMQDAKGHPNYKNKKGLCGYCKSVLKL